MSAAEPRTITLDAGEVTYDANMEMGALKVVLKATSDNNVDGIVSGFAQFVISWPFTGKPSDPEAWDALRRKDFNGLVKGIVTDLGSLGE